MPVLEGPFTGKIPQPTATTDGTDVNRRYARSPERNRASLNRDDYDELCVNNERYQVIDDIDEGLLVQVIKIGDVKTNVE